MHQRKLRHQASHLTESGDHYDYIHEESNQSDSEILLGKVQRDLSRRSKKLSSRKRNLRYGQSSSSDEVKTTSSNTKIATPGKFKPQVAPRTAPKPVPAKRKVLNTSSSSEPRQETSPYQNLSPASLHNNSNHFW